MRKRSQTSRQVDVDNVSLGELTCEDQTGSLFLCCITHLITEDNIVLYATEEDQVESHVDHPQVGTQSMQVAKYTGR